MSSNGSKGTVELPPIIVTPGPDKVSPSGRPGGGGSGGNGTAWQFGSGGGGSLGFGFGGSSKKKRKRQRKRNEARRREEAERAEREKADAYARLEAEARARAEAQARVEATARAQVEREQAIVRHGQLVEHLTRSFQSQKIELEQRYAEKSAGLPGTIQSEIDGGIELLSAQSSIQQQLAYILRQKAKINYLVTSKRNELGISNNIAQAFNGTDPVQQSTEQYKSHLEARSNVDSNNAQQVHQSWLESSTHAHEAKLLADSIALLESQSAELSAQHAELAARMAEGSDAATSRQRQTADASRLWSAVAPAATAPAKAGGVWDKAAQIAKQQFLRSATRALSRSPLLLAAYSPKLGNAELPPPVLGVPLTQLDLVDGLDLEFVASRNGAIDVPHRLHLGEGGAAQWVAADGVEVGSKVRVRSFTWNGENNTYEFIRDGESEPALVWTPIAKPQGSSTSTPAQLPQLPIDPGVPVSPVAPEVEAYPEVVRGLDDYILVYPSDVGVDPVYIVFNTRPGDHRYHQKPKSLPAFPDVKWRKGKTPIQGGGGTRPRWVDRNYIYEWDSQHAELEKYTKRGEHLGAFNHETGVQLKPADKTRRIEP